MKKKYQNKLIAMGLASIFIIVFVLFVSQFGEKISFSIEDKFLKPSIFHPFGTDNMGRDLFLRTIIGFRNTFLIAVLTQIVPFFFGGLLGVFLGYYGSKLDEIMFHFFNIILSFPAIIAAIFMSVYVGGGVTVIVIVFSIYGLIYNIKLVRTEIGMAKNEDYVLGLKVNGISEKNIILDHMLPRGFYALLPLVPMLIGHTMIGVSSFSFLGLGVQPPTPEIGVILKDSLRFGNQAPWMLIFPGLFQIICVLIFTMFSDALERDLRQKTLGGGYE